jgi:hypothetical protein
MKRKSIPPVFTFLLFTQSWLFASTVINTEDHPSGLNEMSEMVPDHRLSQKEIKDLKGYEQRLQRIENRLGRFNKVLASGKSKSSIGSISDPVDKWFWIWVISWGVGILLTVLFGGALAGVAIGIIWFLAFGLGSVALVLWLVKKFG